jgi:PAS domain S-box-containing protein
MFTMTQRRVEDWNPVQGAGSEVLAEAKERYQATFDSAPTGVAHIGLDGRWLEFNEAVCTLTGYSREELQTKTFGDITHPDDLAADWAQARQLLAGEIESYSMEKRYIRKDGTAVWVNLTASLLRNGAGKAVNFIAVIEAIENRKKAEAAKARLAAIVEFTDDAIISKDLNGVVTSWNRAAEHLFGYTAPEAIGRSITLIIPPERILEEFELLGRIRKGENVEHYQTVRQRKDGTLLDVSLTVSAVRDSRGAIIGISVIARDVTEAKAAEERLRQNEERFRTMADAIPQLAWIAQADGAIQWYNRRWFEYTGTTLEQTAGWGWQTVLDPTTLPVVLERWKTAIARGEPLEMVFPLRGRDGVFRSFLTRVQPVKDVNGTVIQWFGTNTEIDELKRTQDELQQAQQKLARHAAELEGTVAERTVNLEEAVEELESYSYSIAHDVRAPLRSMMKFSKILLLEYGEALEPQARSYLSRISSSAERLDQLTQDILIYSRIRKGDMRIERVEPQPLLEEIIDTYPNLHHSKVDIMLQTPLLAVQGNRAGLTQVFSNLLGNAVKFVKRGERPRVVIRSEMRKEWVRLWFEDNGIGIPRSAQKQIFNLFQRLHGPEVYEGTGLGLAIVRKAVERMRGTFGVESEEGVGSRFWVELKRA